nr:reverse transcriptase domain-containing protein [Tanacetum cinerariifolium]
SSAFVKAVEEICVTCGGAHPYYQCLAADGNTFPELRDNIQGYVASAAVNYNQGSSVYRPQRSGSLPSNTIANPKGELKSITTRSGIVLDGPFLHINITLGEALILIPKYQKMLKALLSNKEKLLELANTPLSKNCSPIILKKLPKKLGDPGKFLIPSLILIPKYQKMLKALLSNKEKLLELANTPLSKNCSPVILKKLPKKLGDPGKFLIPCGFNKLKCKSLADLGASINLMLLYVWKKPGLPELISTHMTLKLVNRAICTPAGIARDVFIPVGKFTFPTNFVIVDYESDPRVPLILGRPFLWIARALIDIEPDQGKLTSVAMKDNLEEPQVHVPNVLTTHPTLMLDSDFISSYNSLPEFETFYFDIKEKNSGSTTIHADISLPDLESFNFDFKPDPGELTSIVDSGIFENDPSTTNVNLPPEEDHSPLFAYVVWIFISFLTYPVVTLHLFSFGNEDTIFDPGIAIYHFPSLLPDVSHQCKTFMKFNVYLKLLNESLMNILSSPCSSMDK